MERRPDVIVVGAGIVGTSTALFLAEAGASVLVLERESIGCGASGGSAGMVSPFAEVEGPPALETLAWEGLRLHETLAQRLLAETGIDVQLCALPVLRPAFDEAEAEELRTRTGGPGVRWLDGGEARALEPRLSPLALGALYAPDELQVDSYRLTLALAQAAERRGVTIRYAEVLGLLREGPRVAGVRLRRGPIRADRVVLAAGPWTGPMQRWLGWPIPVVPLRGQIVRLQVPEPPLRCCLLRGGNYVLRKGDGATIAGTTQELVGFRPRTTRAGRAAILAAALRLAPSLGEAAVVGQTACLRPLSGDGLPLLGPVPGWEGLFVATGHGRRGILLGPVSGQVVAALALGRTPGIPIEAFAPARFAAPRGDAGGSAAAG